MNVFNLSMLRFIFKIIVAEYKLAPSLQEVLLEGFVVDNDCFFLKSLYHQQPHISDADFLDKLGYECFINSLHVDDFVDSNDSKVLFVQAILFIERLIEHWNKFNPHRVLKIVLSETDFGFNIKFHIDREKETWINEEDLYKFKEAIMVFSSTLPAIPDL